MNPAKFFVIFLRVDRAQNSVRLLGGYLCSFNLPINKNIAIT